MSDAPYSAKSIEAAIDASRPPDVKQQMNSDYLRSSPEEFASIVKKMESDGKVRVMTDGDGTISQVSLKDGCLEFAGLGVGETTVFDKHDYDKDSTSPTHLSSLAKGGLERVLSGALDAGNKQEK